MLGRCLSGQFNFVLLNMAVSLAPISLVMVLWQTSPFWISILSFLVLREPIVCLEIVSMIVCFAAVALIASQAEQDDDVKTDNATLGYILALTCAFLYAILAVSSRGLRDVPTPIVGFWHTVGGLIGTSLFICIEAAVVGEGFRLANYTLRMYLIAAVGSVFDSGAMLCSTLAYQSDSSGFVALISYMNIVYSFICDQVLFHTKVTALEIVGALVIMFVALGVAFYKIRKANAQKALLKSEVVSQEDESPN